MSPHFERGIKMEWLNKVRLFESIRNAFAGRQSQELAKRKYSLIETGPEAAQTYLNKKRLYLGRGSSLKKLQRHARIAAGLRPLRYETLSKRERKALAKVG
jgi:predicted nucleic acid-binding OB-fold protein